MSPNKRNKAADNNSPIRTEEDVAAEQRRQADIVATQIADPRNTSGVIAEDLTNRLSDLQSQRRYSSGSRAQGPTPFRAATAAPAAVTDTAALVVTTTVPAAALAAAGTPVVAAAAAISLIDLTTIDPIAYRNPPVPKEQVNKNKRKSKSLTLAEYLAQPPPPPPLPVVITKEEKRRKFALLSKVAESAERVQTLLYLKGKVNPTDDDLIAAISTFSQKEKEKRLTSTDDNRQNKRQKRLQQLDPIPFERKKINLLKVGTDIGANELQQHFIRCEQGNNNHARRGRDVKDLNSSFFETVYDHGRWTVDADAPDGVRWSPNFYAHGYFEGERGRWIGHLTPDGKHIYQRNGCVGPAYSGSN